MTHPIHFRVSDEMLTDLDEMRLEMRLLDNSELVRFIVGQACRKHREEKYGSELGTHE